MNKMSIAGKKGRTNRIEEDERSEGTKILDG